ncbi:MAG: DUF1512 domain-containing protein [Candidatus Verstraetearchaeota archaeon]|nr:DUF1512 domain-containing protein [Candidatus Verstraetearchaeota archaeon]
MEAIVEVEFIDATLSIFGDSSNSIIIDILYFLVFAFVITFLNQRVQIWMWLRDAENALRRLNFLLSRAKQTAIKRVKELGKPDFDPSPMIEDFLDFFIIEPVDLDPRGIIEKLDHLLNVRDNRIEAFIKRIAPNVSSENLPNLEGLLETVIVLNTLYREIRHLLLLGKKTKNMVFIMQLQMNLPLLMKYAEAFYNAVDAFSNGKPIGDGVGALVVAKLIYGKPHREIAEKIVASEFDYKGRRIIALKAKGPGAEVGKPGEAIARIIAENGGNISRIIMIDAALKLEGEETGRVAEGIGAAIGGPGAEKYKIEEIATKYKIPLDAIAIKMSLEEAINTIKKNIVMASEKALNKLLTIIEERVHEGETVIVAGIGNTLGISQ